MDDDSEYDATYGDAAKHTLGFEVPDGFGTDRRHSIGAITEQREDGGYSNSSSTTQMVWDFCCNMSRRMYMMRAHG